MAPTWDDIVDPVVLFADSGNMLGHMWWVGDPSLALEMVEGFFDVAHAYDGLARPLRLVQDGDGFTFELVSSEPRETEMRARVYSYYRRFARNQAQEPPDVSDVREFLYAVADDRVDE
ncbi:hypothetical protein [Amycolatopsis keratiniphila]|uniref:Uncharacterized protein n=1 Tax=Amycolatopsis keratiniphila TaxID=129921 RepID=R4T4L4_9PSEU|nr:hypothetical protein [Amycolatopsis keratiniphila]AGM05932.1 hypothetical protein AORI_3347 [Amycolatopsis keratiniphila]